MLLTKEIEYAVRIFDALSKESPLSAALISERQGIPSPFIYRVLKKLESMDFLEIKRGPKGGYTLKVDCSEITLYDVICAFENTFLVIECMKKDYNCTRNSDISCAMHKEFTRLQRILADEFKKTNISELIDE